eukprot:CAMPEP_0206529534 /NCGR_PEP_ID=MMETSP0325_2-20121206/2655_1 /ASSEMBLY_ACC=CAM_ASM_000347 /TAXON_ID=2866 /ORGANISM="Crypthecodinium cohnii, Strain Seligo" /LENGTH=546 /DNA_ID=CAMNT_0054025461 /DNA_START=129 /DNA_END=1768 /DNA_ORIENTATION=+
MTTTLVLMFLEISAEGGSSSSSSGSRPSYAATMAEGSNSSGCSSSDLRLGPLNTAGLGRKARPTSLQAWFSADLLPPSPSSTAPGAQRAGPLGRSIIDQAHDADADLVPGRHRAGRRGDARTAFEGGDGPPSEGDKAKKEVEKREAEKAAKEQEEEDKAKHVIYTSMDGRTARLKATSNKECKADCNESPALKDEAAADEGRGVALMNAISGGEANIIQQCEAFCDEQVPGLKCFPEDATVVVEGRGCLPICELRVCDKVLSSASPGTEEPSKFGLRFDEVLGWLHLDRTATAEMVEIRHESGKLCLSDDHLLYVLQSDEASSEGKQTKVLAAAEANPSDRLFSTWLDGSLATPKVLNVSRRSTRGLYAPLLAGGHLFVDGVLVSCYAVPLALRASSLSLGVSQWTGDPFFLQRAAHALFLPIRMQSALCGGNNNNNKTNARNKNNNNLNKGKLLNHEEGASEESDSDSISTAASVTAASDKHCDSTTALNSNRSEDNDDDNTSTNNNNNNSNSNSNQKKTGLDRLVETVHPYAWVNYVLFSSAFT